MQGFTKDGKFHPIKPYNKKIRSKREPFNVTKDGVKIPQSKLAQMQRDAGIRGKRYAKSEMHLFRVFSTWSNEDNGDRQETAKIKARNLDEAVKFVKKEFFKKSAQKDLEEDGDDETAYISTTYPTDEDGNLITEAQAEKIQDREGDDAVGYTTEGFEIFQDDDTEESFHTIYGGNDFYDLSKPKGKESKSTSADVIKEAGGVEKAFFGKGSGQGFESGNPDNDFNLNTRNLKLYDPKSKSESDKEGRHS